MLEIAYTSLLVLVFLLVAWFAGFVVLPAVPGPALAAQNFCRDRKALRDYASLVTLRS